MPVDPRVQAAHPKMVHCIMNKGYSHWNGGVGRVKPIHMVQPMLMNHAVNSSRNRVGLSL
jgi:hypothetical protein